MKPFSPLSTISVIIAFLLLPVPVISQTAAPLLNTPSGVTQCLRSQLTWTGGTPPFTLLITAGDAPGGTLLKQYNNLTGSTYSLLATLPASTRCVMTLRDSDGRESTTALVTILPGAATSCENSEVVEGGGGGGGTTSISTTSVSTTTPGGGSTSSPATGTSTSTGPTGSATQTGAASNLQVGLAGVAGFIGALVL